MENHANPVVLTGDPLLRDAVLAAAAAAGTTATAITDAAGIADLPVLDQPFVVGIDRAPQVAQTTVPPASATCLIGTEEDRADLCAWSAPLGASVVVVPEGVRWLTSLLAGEQRAGSGRVVGVIGGHGGAGASTLAVSLAQLAAADRSVALVDLDGVGGGLDLLLGAERATGWRWPDLAASAGYIDALATRLPAVGGVPVLSMAREPARAEEDPAPEAVAAVLRSLARDRDLVVVDVGRRLGPGARQGLRHCHAQVLVCGGGVRQVAASAHLLAGLTPGVGVVVRAGGEGAASSAVAEALAAPLWGEVPTESRLAAAAERGEPLGDVSRRWKQACRRVLERIAPDRGGAR